MSNSTQAKFASGKKATRNRGRVFPHTGGSSARNLEAAGTLRLPNVIIESQLERVGTIARAISNFKTAVTAEHDANAQEEQQRSRMPRVWASDSNIIANATGIQSTHTPETTVDPDAIREMVDGNIMGLKEVIDPAQNEQYLEKVIQDDTPATPVVRDEGSLDPLEHAGIVDGLARTTAQAREIFEGRV